MPAHGAPDLTRVELGGVFFLHGDDEFRKARATEALIETHLDVATRDFNFDVIRGREADVEALASAIATPPMMADWRVVLVREAEGLAASAKTRAVVLDTVERPPPGLALVLVATVPARSTAKFYRDLRKKARAVEFPVMSQDDVPGWVVEWASQEYGATFDLDAARALAAGLGSELGVLDREIAKLSEMVGEGTAVGLADVERAGTRLPKQDRWKWFDLVGHKRFEEARFGLPVLLDQGETGVGLVIGLATHLLRLGVVVADGPSALGRLLPQRQSWLAQRLVGQGRLWTVPELEAAVLGLLRTDQLLKASPMPDEHHVESWLLELSAAARSTRGGEA